MGRRGAGGALIRRILPTEIGRALLLVLVLAAGDLAASLAPDAAFRAAMQEWPEALIWVLLLSGTVLRAGSLLLALRIGRSTRRPRAAAIVSIVVGGFLVVFPWFAAPVVVRVDLIEWIPWSVKSTLPGLCLLYAGVFALLRRSETRKRIEGAFLSGPLAVALVVCLGISLDLWIQRGVQAARVSFQPDTVRIRLLTALPILAAAFVALAELVAFATPPRRIASLLALTAAGGLFAWIVYEVRIAPEPAGLLVSWVPGILTVAGAVGLWRSFRRGRRGRGDPVLDSDGNPG